MTDIVERLRRLEVTICHEAADEIERLRDERAILRSTLRTAALNMTDQTAAIKRVLN